MKAIAIVVVAALAGAFALGTQLWREARTQRENQARARILTQIAARPSPVRFVDITRAAGIRFRYHSGTFGAVLFPEQMGGGAAFIDYDGDGLQDLFLPNARDWTRAEIKQYRNGTGRAHRAQHGFVAPDPPPGKSTTGALYRNLGNGTFADVTKGSGLDVEMYGLGASVGDYDNDGRPDLYITGYGRNYLFHNQFQKQTSRMSTHVRGAAAGQPVFKDVSEVSGVRGDGLSSSSAWVDYDRDGRLDLFVCHYSHWTPATDQFSASRGGAKVSSSPNQYGGEHCRLYHNLGGQPLSGVPSGGVSKAAGARFEDVSKAAGIQVSGRLFQRDAVPQARGGRTEIRSKALGVALCDFNADGWPDLAVANDQRPNFLFQNLRNGTFREVATRAGVAVQGGETARSGMGIDSGDISGEGRDSLVIGNFAEQALGLYENQGSGLFKDIAPGLPVQNDTRQFLTFGCLMSDVDNDSRLDILLANGHVRLDSNFLRQRPVLLLNRTSAPPTSTDSPSPIPGRTFEEMDLKTGAALQTPILGRGLAAADFDLDGDTDYIFSTNDGAPLFLRNDPTPGQKINNALRISLQGTRSNRSAIGAVVEARVGSLLLHRMVKSGSSYLSQSELPITLGLGQAAQVDSLVVLWPSGKRSELKNIKANQSLIIDETRGIIRTKTLLRRDATSSKR